MNPTEVAIEWTASTDDGPYLFYQVFVNGSPSVDARQNRFTVIAVDQAGNRSEPASVVIVSQ